MSAWLNCDSFHLYSVCFMHTFLSPGFLGRHPHSVFHTNSTSHWLIHCFASLPAPSSCSCCQVCQSVSSCVTRVSLFANNDQQSIDQNMGSARCRLGIGHKLMFEWIQVADFFSDEWMQALFIMTRSESHVWIIIQICYTSSTLQFSTPADHHVPFSVQE